MSADTSESRDELQAELEDLRTLAESGQRRGFFAWVTGRGRNESDVAARARTSHTEASSLSGQDADSEAQESVSEDELRSELAALKALVLAQQRRGLLGRIGWLASNATERQARFRRKFKATVLDLTPPDSELSQEQQSTRLGRVTVVLRRHAWVKVLAPFAVLAIFGLWWIIIVKVAGF